MKKTAFWKQALVSAVLIGGAVLAWQSRDELRSRGYRGSLVLVHNSGGMGGLAIA